jgi:uncharacterized protein YpmB
MKSKWIWLTVIIIIVIISLLISLYTTTMSSEKKLSKLAITRAQEEIQLIKVNDVEHFHGIEAYHVIDALAQQGSIYIFVPEDNSKKITYVQKDEGITKKQAKEIIASSKENIKIIDIRLGIDDNTPVWEIVYEENEDQRTFIYVTYKSGKLFKRLTISK